MSKAKLLWFIPAIVLILIAGNAVAISPSQAPAPAGPALIAQYCVTCHNQQDQTGGLALDTMDFANVGKSPAVWEHVVRKVRTGMMPPSGARRPDRAALDAFASDLETRLDRAAALKPNPGSPGLHRLNRTEYANAIRDLLHLDVDVTTLLPADDSNEGFDNNADALGVSPSFIQGYVTAAMKISRLAVGDRTLAPSQTTYLAPSGLVQDRHIDGLPLGTHGGMLIRHTFPLDGEYQFNIAGGNAGGPRGGGGNDLTLDGQSIPSTRNAKIAVKAGPHTIGVAVPDARRTAGVDEDYSDFRVNSAFAAGGGIQSLVIIGPYNSSGTGDTPSRSRILTCRPQAAAEETPCARKVVAAVARRAFRGPALSEPDVDALMVFYQQGRKGGDFETGIQEALARVLVAPRFLYRSEDEPATVKPGGTYRISDVALASRLSFFLWSSIPDDELLDLASQGRLKDPLVFDKQVLRMLKDPKSDALVKNFAGQWLYLRDLASVQPDTKEFDDNLRQAFRRETEMLFDSIVREDRSIVTLLDADYTFVNERLARHYGIPNIHGDYFRRIPLASDSPRRGLIGQGSILTVTSVANRTSPVLRGKWILQNVLGIAAPNPPPGVERNLDPDPKAAKPTTVRERLEQHRVKPECASCHKIMDPIGFSLENFDMIGKWRESDGGQPIDTAGVLVDGTAVINPADLRKALLSRSGTFVTSATEKLMTYALGRGVEYYDMPAVRSIVQAAGKNDQKFSALVLGIARSAPFQMKMKK